MGCKLNTNRKGWHTEHEAIALFKKLEGNVVVWKPSRTRFHSNDVYTLFDFIAKGGKGWNYFVQVKTGWIPKETKEQIHAFAMNWGQLIDRFIIMRKYPTVKRTNNWQWLELKASSDSREEILSWVERTLE